MSFTMLPDFAAWQHGDVQRGFEVTFFEAIQGGYTIRGSTAAVEEGRPWAVNYTLVVDSAWVTRSARVHGRSRSGAREVHLQGDGAGSWLVNGEPAPALDGCLDVDLESSAMTNTLPVHRMRLRPGDQAPAPAAYVRADGLAIERLEQSYRCRSAQAGRHEFDYESPAFGFSCLLTYDGAGLALDYPGIAVRAI